MCASGICQAGRCYFIVGRERRKLPRKNDVTECIILVSTGRPVIIIVVSTTIVKIWRLDSVILKICGCLRCVLI
jgi:hypothetical protein